MKVNLQESGRKIGMKKVLTFILIIMVAFLWGCPKKTKEVSSLEQRLSKYKNAPPDALYKLALVAAFSKKYDTAEYFLKLVIEKRPRFAQAYSALGLIYLKLKDYQKAEMLFQKALSLNPDLPEALMNMGVIRIYQKRYLEAKDYLEKAIEADSSYVDALFNLGHLYDKLGDYTAAISVFKRLVEVAPEVALFHYQLGTFYLKKEMFDEALGEFLKSQKCDPDKYQAYYQAAIIYHMKKRIYQAVKNYKKAILLKPTNFESYLNLGDIYLFELQDKDQARYYYEKARSVRPEDAYVNKRIREIDSGKYDYLQKKSLFDFMTEEDKLEYKKSRQKGKKKIETKEDKFKHGQVLYIRKVEPKNTSSEKKENSVIKSTTPPPPPSRRGKFLQFSNPEELKQLLQKEGIGL